MSKIKKLSVLALILLVIGIVGSFFTYSYKQNEVIEEQIIKEKFQTVRINSDNAVVDIMPTSSSAAKVELITRGVDERNLTYKVDAKGNNLSILVKEPFHFQFGFYSIHLKVLLPKKQYKTLEIKNDNGNVQLEQIKSKKVQVSVNNGRIQVSQLISKRVEVGSHNGEIQLHDVEGDIKGLVNNGKIDVKTKDLDRPMQLETHNGKIMIQTDKEPTNTRFEVSIDNGDVNILNKYHDDATIGKGENLINLTTNNGEILVISK